MGFLTGPLVPAPESSHRAWIGQRFSYPIASLLPSHIRYATSVDRPIAQVTSGLSRGVSPWRTRDTKTASARDQPPSSRRNEGATANHFIRGRRWRRTRPGRPPGRPRRTRRRRWSCGRSRPGGHTAIPRWPRSRILNAAASVSRSERIRECWRGSADRVSGVRTPLSDRSYTFGRDIGQAANRGQHLVTRCYVARLLRAGVSLAQHRGLPSRDRCLHRRRDDAHPFAAWLRPP